MSWGLILNPNTRCTQIIEHSFHLTRAILFEHDDGSAYAQVMLQYRDNPHYFLCQLSGGKSLRLSQIPLDLKFTKGDMITFTTIGQSVVQLRGALITDDEKWKEKDNGGRPNDIPRHISNSTVVKGDQYNGNWRINNFTKVTQITEKAICSKIFSDDRCEIKWTLKLYPAGKEERYDEYVSLRLCFDTRDSELVKKNKVTAYCSLTFNNQRPVTSFICLDEEVIEYQLGYGITQTASPLNRFRDEVSVYYSVLIFTEPRPLAEALEKELLFDVKQRKLNHDFGQLFKEPKEFSDVVLSVGGEKISAHKIILTTRSPVFAAMFQCKEMIENRKNEVVIEGMEPIVVKAMLEFIYTDAVENLDMLAPGLLEAADKYELRRLKTLCERSMCKSFETDNAAEYLILTDRHHSYALKQYIIEFIKDHRKDVRESEGYEWMEKNYPALVEELNRSFDSEPECEYKSESEYESKHEFELEPDYEFEPEAEYSLPQTPGEMPLRVRMNAIHPPSPMCDDIAMGKTNERSKS